MTNKELLLDCLVDGGETETQIIQFFVFQGSKSDIKEIKRLIKELIDEGLICTHKKWVNECGEFPYTLTAKGNEVWKKIKT